MTFNELNFDLSKVESGTVKHITVDMEPEISEQEEELVKLHQFLQKG